MLVAQIASGVGSSIEVALREHPVAALPALFGAGLLTSLTPCVYPMIPITAGILGGAGAAVDGVRPTRQRTLLLSLTYAVGLATVYALLGTIAGATGALFGTISSSPWAYLLIANLLIVFALSLLGVFEIRVPQRFLAWTGKLASNSLGGVFLMGATSGLVAAPCGAPVFATVLTFVATTKSAGLGFVYLFVFSLGMTVLLVAIGAVSGLAASLPRSGVWMLWVKRAAGVLLLGMAEYYLIQVGRVT